MNKFILYVAIATVMHPLSGILFAKPIFQEGFEPGSTPWSGSGKITAEQSHTGKNSLQLDSGSAFLAPNTSSLIPIEPGHDYRITFYAKTQNLANGAVALTAVCRRDVDGEKRMIGSWLKGVQPRFPFGNLSLPALVDIDRRAIEWTAYEAKIPASQIPSDANYLHLYLRHESENPQAAVYVDDIVVERMPEGTYAESDGGFLEGNRIKNGDFELGLMQWQGPGAKTANLTREGVKDDGQALVLKSRYVYQPRIPIEPGKNIKISMRIKCDGVPENAANAQISYNNQKGWTGPVSVPVGGHTERVVFSAGGTHDWKDIQVVLAPPPGAKSANFYLRNRKEGSFYFDKVALQISTEPPTQAAELRAQGLAPTEPLLEDPDFAHVELINPTLVDDLKGWRTSGIVTPLPEGGPNGGPALRFSKGDILQGLVANQKQAYKVTFWSKPTAMADDTFQVNVKYRHRGKAMSRHGTTVTTLGGSGGWEQTTTYLKPPERTTEMILTLKKNADDGYIDIANVQVTAVEDIPEPAEETPLLLPPAGDPVRAIQAALRAAAQPAASGLDLVKHGTSIYRIVASPEGLFSTASFTLPDEALLSALTISSYQTERISGNIQKHRRVNFSTENLKSAILKVRIKSSHGRQAVRANIRLTNASREPSQLIHSSFQKLNGTGWQWIRIDLTPQIQRLIQNGYRKPHDIHFNTYNPNKEAVCWLDEVQLLVTDADGTHLVYANREGYNKQPFMGGTMQDHSSDQFAGNRRFQVRSQSGRSYRGELVDEAAEINVSGLGFQKEIHVDVPEHLNVEIREIQYTDKRGKVQSLDFANVNQSDSPTDKITGIQFASKQWTVVPGVSARISTGKASTPKNTELYAAEELNHYLGKMSGVEFQPFSSDLNLPENSPLIIIGRNNSLIDRLAPDIPYERLGEDGFIIRSVGPHLIIAGAEPRGTLYGVYWFLDRMLGVRWYSRAYTYIPQKNTIRVDAAINETQVARFRYRELFSRDGDDIAYRHHNLLNGRSHHRVPKGGPRALDTWSQHWTGVGHNFFKVIPEKKFHEGGQLKMMNEQVRTLAADRFVKAYDRQKDDELSFMAFSQQDTGWNPDDDSQTFANQHGGSLSAPLIDMVSDTANRVRKKRPNAKMGTLAYQWSFPAPENLSVPDYVQITLAPIYADFSQPFNGPRNMKTQGQEIVKWAKIAEELAVWEYSSVNFSSYVQPHPTLDTSFDNIQWLATFPQIHAYFSQGAYGSVGANFGNLRQWVGARLLWDPSLDYKALIEEFCQGYFGPKSAPYVLKYIDLLHQSKRDAKTVMNFRVPFTASYLTFDLMTQADDIMDKAIRAAAGNPGFERRLKTLRIGIDVVILMRRADYKMAAREKGVDWDPQTEVRLKRLSEDSQIAGISKFGEGTGRMSTMIETMRLERRRPEPLNLVKGLPDEEWIELQDLDLLSLARVNTVADDKASDLGASRMPGNTGAWGIQVPLDRLPSYGKWRFYVSVRIDKGVDSDPDVRAITFGVHPGPKRSISKEMLLDEEYHTFAVPGIYINDAGKRLWFAPPNSKNVSSIYVDRVTAIMVAD